MGQGLVVILTPWNTPGGAGIGGHSNTMEHQGGAGIGGHSNIMEHPRWGRDWWSF